MVESRYKLKSPSCRVCAPGQQPVLQVASLGTHWRACLLKALLAEWAFISSPFYSMWREHRLNHWFQAHFSSLVNVQTQGSLPPAPEEQLGGWLRMGSWESEYGDLSIKDKVWPWVRKHCGVSCWYFRNKLQQTEWLEQQKCVLSEFSRLDIWHQGVGRVSSFWGLWGRICCMPPPVSGEWLDIIGVSW